MEIQAAEEKIEKGTEFGKFVKRKGRCLIRVRHMQPISRYASNLVFDPRSGKEPGGDECCEAGKVS